MNKAEDKLWQNFESDFHLQDSCNLAQVDKYTKTLKKKDALLKPQFDRLSVITEQKLKKGIKALVLSFHLQRPAAL